MSKPQGEGRIFTNGITYTDPAKNVKDDGLFKSKLPMTEGMEAITRTPMPTRPFSTGAKRG